MVSLVSFFFTRVSLVSYLWNVGVKCDMWVVVFFPSFFNLINRMIVIFYSNY